MESEREHKSEQEKEEERKEPKQTEERYDSISDLPRDLRSTLPEEAQALYLEQYQESWDSYEGYEGGELGRAAVAHRDGWHAVRQEYAKHEASGRWYPHDELPEEEEEEEPEDGGLIDQIKDIF